MIIKKSKSLLKNSEKRCQIGTTSDLLKINSADKGKWDRVIDFTKIQKGGMNVATLLKKL